MFTFSTLTRFAGVAAIALGTLTFPHAAAAQDLPSYAQPANVSTDETVHGRIRSVDGAFTISVDDDRGFVDNVRLHGGTIINPTGLTLSPGMSVTILGVNSGATFDANEIDTPYTYSGPLPTPVYLGPGYWCPGFAYGYGPSFSLGIVIGGERPWYYEHRPFYGRPWNGYGYFGTYVGRLPEPRGRTAEQHPLPNSSVRYPTSVRAHAPSAFAGRSFAGESRFYSNESSAPSTFYHAESAPRTMPGAANPSYGATTAPSMRASAPYGGGFSRGSSPGGGASRSAPAAHGGGHTH